ncbi:hypothetical protein C8034_v010026 [Colletotrichum sidae]|uniref:DUF6604 domain-containing protein n=1 Tax=Colletotrichum sidae TaxID=1347389 RepID=A0A4R8TH74_9PEZI|nr:hypothetical protein C8034_v010026 [Colletotrichum sidae]
MLPSPLVSTYQRYKKDTDAVASWLASTAKACGYPADLLGPPEPPKPKRKGKKKKPVSKPRLDAQSPYVVAIKDFIPLAQHIAASKKPVVDVPETFARTITRVIDTRSSFGSQMDQHGLERDVKSDETHSFFVGVLEQVREILKPRMSASSAHWEKSSVSKSGDALVNSFSTLTVYEPSASFIDAPDIERPVNTNDSDKTVYVSEAPSFADLEEAVFAYALMLDDLNKIRSQVRSIWRNYRAGLYELASAAVATNTAIDLSRNIIDEVIPILQPHGGVRKIASTFYITVMLSKGFSVESLGIDPNQASGTGYFNYDTYDLADTMYYNVWRLLDAFSRVLTPRGIPLFKPGYYGIYDPSSNRETKSGQEKFQEDQILIMELCTELVLIARRLPTWPVEDGLLRGMKELIETRELPFSLVFAVQIYLDIHHSLREDVVRGLHEMVKSTSIIRNDVARHLEFHQNLKIRTWPASNDAVLKSMNMMIGWLGRDPIHDVKVKEYRESGTVLSADTEKYYLLRNSPVMAGLILYHYRAQLYDIGITVANAWGSMTCSAHLYNALQSERLLQDVWKDMDVAMSLLGQQSFFVGGAPKTAADYLKKFCWQMGTSVAAFANPKNRRAKVAIESRAGPRGIKQGAPVSSIFAERYVNGASNVEWTAEYVEKIISRSEWGEQEQPSAGIPPSVTKINDPKKPQEIRSGRQQKQAAKDGRLSPDQLVRSLALALQSESLEFAYPYLLLHRWCWQLLRAIKERCDPLLREIFTAAYMEKETELPFVVGYILLANSGVEAQRKDDRLMKAAAEAINSFLSVSGELCIDVAREGGFDVSFEFEEDEE